MLWVYTGSITEVFGEFRTGKTQLAHTLCVTSQLSFQMHGGQGKIIYLDTEGNFRPERIETIAERFGLDVEQTLDNIIICRIFSHEEQMEVLKPIAALLSDHDQGPFRLLIVDSIIGTESNKNSLVLIIPFSADTTLTEYTYLCNIQRYSA